MICLRLRRVIQYADDLKVIIILVAKVLSCGVFLQEREAPRAPSGGQSQP